jgi:hypothetical protein
MQLAPEQKIKREQDDYEEARLPEHWPCETQKVSAQFVQGFDE